MAPKEFDMLDKMEPLDPKGEGCCPERLPKTDDIRHKSQ